MTSRKLQYWVIPPHADAEFVANMEEVLETYAKPYDRTRPVLCMDEQPVQIGEGDANADQSHCEASATGRLRVRAGWHRSYFYVHRAAFGMATGNGTRIQNQSGLGD
jgi:hypothetical protein